MIRHAWVVLAACHGPDPVGCTVELSGNFIETSTSSGSCPKLAPGAGATRGDTLINFAVASPALGGNFAISLDLGPSPTPGAYNSGTTDLWSAKGEQAVAPGGACVFLASNNSTPNGDFVLELSRVAPLHGTLALDLFVLPRASATGKQTDCGPGATETLRIAF
jgi:hypothetical protein